MARRNKRAQAPSPSPPPSATAPQAPSAEVPEWLKCPHPRGDMPFCRCYIVDQEPPTLPLKPVDIRSCLRCYNCNKLACPVHEEDILQKCSLCKRIAFCSRECLIEGWPAHRVKCKQFRLGKLGVFTTDDLVKLMSKIQDQLVYAAHFEFRLDNPFMHYRLATELFVVRLEPSPEWAPGKPRTVQIKEILAVPFKEFSRICNCPINHALDDQGARRADAKETDKPVTIALTYNNEEVQAISYGYVNKASIAAMKPRSFFEWREELDELLSGEVGVLPGI